MAYRKSLEYKIPKEDEETEKQQEEREAEQLRIDNAEELTPEEIEEKEKLYNEVLK